MPALVYALLFALARAARVIATNAPPNVVIVFADNLGYGDLGCFGSETISTPNRDRMAAEEMKFTSPCGQHL